MGIDNPRPINDEKPSQKFETLIIQSNELLEGWLIEREDANEIILLFHGYSSCKSGMLEYAEALYEMGFSTLLIDFQGSGGSTGNKTTIGVEESEYVKAVYSYVKDRFPDHKVVLFGSSMGAVSIMKSVADSKLKPDKLILECPFGTMKATMEKRFDAMGIPSFPAADLLLFYGGAINGFNAFNHNPKEYAKELSIPTLLLHGSQDQRVLVNEMNEIYNNISGEKKLVLLNTCGHQMYLGCEEAAWKEAIQEFLIK